MTRVWWRKLSYKKTAVSIALGPVFIVSLFLVLKTLFLDYYPDFSCYYLAARDFLAGANPYLNGQKYFAPFVYPPTSFIIFVPFSLFPYQTAEKIWTAVSLICLSVSLFALLKIFHQKVVSLTGAAIFTLACLYFPVRYTLGMGQINLLIFALLVLTVRFYLQGNYRRTGFFLAVSVMLKLFPLLFLPYFIIRREWQTLRSFAFVVGVASLTVYLLHPLSFHYYVTQTVPDLLSNWQIDYYNQSLAGLIGRGFTDHESRVRLKNILTLLILLYSFWLLFFPKKTGGKTINLELGLLVTTGLLINNFSWQHHFVWLLFPLLSAFFYIKQSKLSPWWYLPLAISYSLTAVNLKIPSAFPPLFQSHLFFGALIIFFLITALLRFDKKS